MAETYGPKQTQTKHYCELETETPTLPMPPNLRESLKAACEELTPEKNSEV